MPGPLEYTMSPLTIDKETLFTNLEQLDCLSDGPESEFDRLIAASRRQGGKVPRDEEIPPDGSCLNKNQSPMPQSHVSTQSSPDLVVTHSVSLTEPAVSNLESNPKTMPDQTGHAAKAGKRKRAPSARVVPEQQRIFKGLVFFFFPNSDVSPLRRLRIQKAQEYGALWAKEWGDNITHVIVDKGLEFEEILKHLKLETFPPKIAVVDECYPAECIKFRCVLSVTQIRFQVKGVPSSSRNEKTCDSPAIEGPPIPRQSGSLPLKSAHKQPRETQRSSQPSDHPGPLTAPDAASQGERSQAATEEIVYESFPAHERDALDEMIEEAKAVKDLPLDPLDSVDDNALCDASGDDTSQDSEHEPWRRKRRKSSHDEHGADEAWQQKFVCMQKHDSTSNSDNPNAKTIKVLQQMLDYYTRTNDHWRILAYRKAISALRNQRHRVVTRKQALAIPTIGPRLADKIEEIVLTDRLRRLENVNNTAEERLIQEFLAVYGAGLSHASRWVAQGYKSLEDLRDKATLTPSQRIGIERYFDFSQRIPRSEVQAHGDFVRRVVQKENPEMQVIIGGSYRRGAADSGDIDLLITKPDATIEEIRTFMLDIVVPKLFQQKFLQAALANTSRDDGSKWHGASKLPNGQLWRRIDLLFVPGSEIGAALIYFTGNDIFNRSMRLLASKKSMRLNQRGLYADVLRGPQRTNLNAGRLIESRDERRIFEILGVPWRPPEHRIC
ncbi:hypothetical protein BJX61DRAFT_249072 [Aspergillus egyptiacus]|nr:hypothetical protein BJX61DRAFT_249072 [Aspergillus egyptiacus]